MTSGPRKYRINAVSRMTGVSTATLRAWERRYGLPVPSRTDAAYRMYSDHDVDLIRRVLELCERGIAPSEATALVLEQERALPEPAANTKDPFEPSRRAILEAIETFNPLELESAVQHALALGSAAQIYESVLREVMLEVGERWHRGEFTVGQEHLATQVIENAARRMLGLLQPPGKTPQVILACFAEDEHTLPLYGVGLHVALAGYRVVMLGARTPPSAIQHAVREIAPAWVGLSATVAPPLHEARALVDAYADACRTIPWVLGGAAAESLRPFVEARGGAIANATAPGDFGRVIHGLVARGQAGRRRTSEPS